MPSHEFKKVNAATYSFFEALAIQKNGLGKKRGKNE
jgi:hypothetical protein